MEKQDGIKIEINSIEDLFFYFDSFKRGEITNERLCIGLDSFVKNFSIILRYNDSLSRLNATIDSQLAQAIIDFQEFIYKTYKVLRYQDSPRELSDDEKASLKIYVKILRGSTIEEIVNLGGIIDKMVEGMDGKQKLIAFFILISAMTAGYLVRKVIEYLAKKSDNEKEEELSRQETEREEKIISGFTQITKYIEDRPLYSEAIKDGQKALLKPVKNNNSYTLGIRDNLGDESTLFQEEILVDSNKAKKILRSTRSPSETETITDYYYVKYIEALDDGGYKTKLKSSTAEAYGIVEFDINDENIDCEAIFNSMASREPIKLTVKTKTINGIVSVEKLIATTN